MLSLEVLWPGPPAVKTGKNDVGGTRECTSDDAKGMLKLYPGLLDNPYYQRYEIDDESVEGADHRDLKAAAEN